MILSFTSQNISNILMSGCGDLVAACAVTPKQTTPDLLQSRQRANWLHSNLFWAKTICPKRPKMSAPIKRSIANLLASIQHTRRLAHLCSLEQIWQPLAVTAIISLQVHILMGRPGSWPDTKQSNILYDTGTPWWQWSPRRTVCATTLVSKCPRFKSDLAAWDLPEKWQSNECCWHDWDPAGPCNRHLPHPPNFYHNMLIHKLSAPLNSNRNASFFIFFASRMTDICNQATELQETKW